MSEVNRKIAALRGGAQLQQLDYERDLNAALWLAFDIPRFSLTKTSSGLYLEWYRGEWNDVTIESPQDLASGICKMYLMWKGVKNE